MSDRCIKCNGRRKAGWCEDCHTWGRPLSGLKREMELAIHAASTWCEFGPNARAEHCDGSCREIADIAYEAIIYES